MCGRPSTTIGFERRYNPFAHLDRAQFVARLTAAIPARPLNMVAIEATNRGRADMPWAMLTSLPDVAQVTVDQLAARLPGALVLDVREPAEYARGHVPGARNLPQAELASWLHRIPHDSPVYLVCQSGQRSLRAAQFLLQSGYHNVASLAGGTAAWQLAGKSLAIDDAVGVAAPDRGAISVAP
jgi:rhodanese-related sulfurtransferase